MTGVNWAALILLVVACYGVYEHAVALYDALLDRRAMLALHHEEELAVYSVETDIRDESWRMVAKILFAAFYFLAMLNPNATMDSNSGFLGWFSFFVLLAAMASLTINTLIRKRARRHMLFGVLVRKGESV